MGVDILREILALAEKDESADPFGVFTLRYTLEYPADRLPLDVAGEAARIADILASNAFQLTPLAQEKLPEFFILSFPAIERVLPDDQLYSIGYALADALHLTSCEPDLGTPYFSDPEEPDPAAAESTRIVGALCLADPPPPVDRSWAITNARIDRAWTLSRGEGIIIAQPDTGVAMHDELRPEHLGLDRAIDILTGQAAPTDPLRAGMANPGHGTATGSVAAGRTEGRIAGAAPAATLVPIRCIDDVKIFNAAPVAAAIAHAIRVGAQVITMSLGGIPSRAIHAAVQRAVAADIIVVAAAGNCVRTVVWPARYAEVIAVGGTNAADKVWKGSSRGDAVDISAPAEFVWVARRQSPADTDLGRVEPGQGTSFATALTAGCAALWLAHHGPQAVVAEARKRGVSVQELFRRALALTARRPDGWNGDDHGAGIVDAERLLGLALDDIGPSGVTESVHHPMDSGSSFFAEELGVAQLPGERFLPEIANIALRQRMNGAMLKDLRVEAKLPGTVASPELMAAVQAAGDARLEGFLVGETKQTAFAPPPFAAERLRETPGAALRTLGSRLESAGEALQVDAARDYLNGAGRSEQLQHFEKSFASAPGGFDRELFGKTFQHVSHALDAIAGKRAMDFSARTGLEALVLLNGRPALRVHGTRIDFNDPQIGNWHDKLFLYFSNRKLDDKIAAIGRIDADDVHWGTGFVVGDGLVLTNRHVLQQIAAPIPRRNGPKSWVLTKANPTIDFADAPTSETIASKFKILEVVQAGDKDIDPYLLDFTKLDAALLKVERKNGAGESLPSAIDLVSKGTSADLKKDVLTIGYPAAPASLPRSANGQIDEEIVDRLQEIFGADYGCKYLAPGKVTERSGSVFFYDATTLAGCSGSAVLRTETSFDAVGLHFGGQWRSANYAHNLPVLAPTAALLNRTGIKWVS